MLEQNKAEIRKKRAERKSGTFDTLKIGGAMPDFNLHESVYYSHNYYRRGKKADEAECLMCEFAHIKTLLKTTDGSTKGLASHLKSKHFEYFEQFELQMKEVLKRRAESKILKRKSSKNEI